MGSETRGIWFTLLAATAALALFAWAAVPIVTGSLGVLAALFACCFILAGRKREKAVGVHLVVAGGAGVVIGICFCAFGVLQYRSEVQPPVTRQVVAHWEAGTGLFVRLSGPEPHVYEVVDRSSWPPADGADVCLIERRPARFGRATVIGMRPGACDGYTNSAPVRRGAACSTDSMSRRMRSS